MAGDEKPRAEAAEGRRRRRAVLFYQTLVNHAIELGQIARIENEIQHHFSHSVSPPRCPCWHDHSSPHGHDALR